LVRGEVMSLTSLIGGLLTIFSAFLDTFARATRARVIARNLQWFTTKMWRLGLPFLEMPLRPIDVIFLNMALFLSMLVLA
jgi:hypothetical protein